MMNLNFNNVGERKVSPFLSPGSGLVLKINDINLDESKNNKGQFRPVFSMESEPINDPSFNGVDGAVGKIGKISGNAGYYLRDDNQIQEFLGGLREIARSIGKEEELSQVEAPDLPTLVERVRPILRGGYARYFVAGREFPKAQNKHGLKLVFLNRNFVESTDANPSKLEVFDRNNPKHYTKLPTTPNQANDFPAETKKNSADDLPF